ncbi:hypothetical protein HS088_TW08G00536 [Tripterygium wilfordii]|uniref:Transcription factor bHLH143-like n=1 Tax=Tripterygium wilfordii TaxID=458696 RepID=A0A7J7DCG2_TRIWF|nr:transcription factor SAC51-like [Tripterygium wilfordii]XP_038709189.1 transcription factor SAC51-like [Tripterygium wilfordii]XP_038709190.1 transcription factor SAC51-like [Tripterygium wilfordii]KAF5743948.1 hypothetical protein HS088_TW08G00536 [Tripterygium wilfordii]
MVKVNKIWHYPQNSALQLPDLNCMTSPFEPRQRECILAHTNLGACMFSTNKELPGAAVPVFSSLMTEQANEAHGLLHCFPPSFQTLPSANVYLKENQSMFSSDLGKKAPLNGISGSPQKKFLVFDQSASGTRLIYSSVYPPAHDLTSVVAKLASGYKSQYEAEAVKLNENHPVNTVLHGTSCENHESEGNEMHEDTEEINALLYSDDTDNYDDIDYDDDEVTSTGHSPTAIEDKHEKRSRAEEIVEEVGSTDGSNKRQKLVDGWYKRSSLMDTASSVKDEGSYVYDNDTVSCHAIGQNQGAEMVSILGNKPSRKDKILSTMKILEIIIPGAKGNDPSLVLDKAIEYLKSLKLKAKTLGMND